MTSQVNSCCRRSVRKVKNSTSGLTWRTHVEQYVSDINRRWHHLWKNPSSVSMRNTRTQLWFDGQAGEKKQKKGKSRSTSASGCWLRLLVVSMAPSVAFGHLRTNVLPVYPLFKAVGLVCVLDTHSCGIHLLDEKAAYRPEGSPKFPLWTSLLKSSASNVTPSWAHQLRINNSKMTHIERRAALILLTWTFRIQTWRQPPSTALLNRPLTTIPSRAPQVHFFADTMIEFVVTSRSNVSLLSRNTQWWAVTTWNLGWRVTWLTKPTPPWREIACQGSLMLVSTALWSSPCRGHGFHDKTWRRRVLRTSRLSVGPVCPLLSLPPRAGMWSTGKDQHLEWDASSARFPCRSLNGTCTCSHNHRCRDEVHLEFQTLNMKST